MERSHVERDCGSWPDRRTFNVPTPNVRTSMSLPFRPKQSLGQNFLQDPNMAEKIVGTLGAPSDAHVVEVGAGTGVLTERLAQRVETLTA
ncbi:MAG: ribosomal RNA small subunit methyltransferase A, partial [Bacteroidetes bacterium QS_4_64_154]